ncbi:hypothetical protein Q428_02665 [Fervidicella metallireducens AeB]|uniref:Diguanylate cyclase n=1 Tax=Fervidicella metallireducens AeB TaxID=1403537 RepID=A0A017RXA1_9CLOT|nr:sensor domain-containing diguanylate cyclase [Fervidicella metallireducens]EYE89408.1 hypothetical protein Q428_02665 [Fervidicella metallireducens AeB]
MREKSKEYDLINQSKLMSQIMESIEEVVFLQSVCDREVLYLNKGYSNFIDCEYEDFKINPRVWTNFVHPNDRKMVDEELRIDNILKQLKENNVLIKELRLMTKHGIKWMRIKVVPIYNENGEIYRIVGIGQDITDQKELQIKLQKVLKKTKKLAMFDYLTNVNNRRAFYKRAYEEINRLKRSQGTFSAILIDIDDFKKINDTFGHDVGDEVIKDIARTLKKGIRRYDILARMGGEEFIIILPNTGIENTYARGEELRKAIEKRRIYIKEKDININYTASIGIATLRKTDNYNLDKVIKRADNALYNAKKLGKNRVSSLK